LARRSKLIPASLANDPLEDVQRRIGVRYRTAPGLTPGPFDITPDRLMKEIADKPRDGRMFDNWRKI